MVIVVGILLMLAYDKFPKNDYVDQQQFLIGLAIIAFLYFFAELSRGGSKSEGFDDDVRPHVRVMSLTDALSDAANSGANVHYIRMFDGAPGYSPASLNIRNGDIVVWTNVGEVQHTVTSAKRSEWMLNHRMTPGFNFDSGQLRPGQSFAVKFLEAGWLPYYDIPNEGWMHGEINVD
jgi:plastocyanin